MTHRVDEIDPLFVALSLAGTLGLVWLVLALLAALWRRAPELFALGLMGIVSAQLLTVAIKRLTDRPRPFAVQREPQPLVDLPLDPSFPSGHASTGFAAATLLARALPRLAVPLYLLAAAIAASRVYVGVHYPGDVLVGVLLGLAVGLLLASGVRALRWPRASRRRSPPAPPRG